MERSRLLSAPGFFSESWRSRLTLITVRAVILERFQILDSKCDVSGSPGAGIGRCGADIARATRLERCHFSSTLCCVDNTRVTTNTQCQRSVPSCSSPCRIAPPCRVLTLQGSCCRPPQGYHWTPKAYAGLRGRHEDVEDAFTGGRIGCQ
ncbi:hypothetical protein IG631_14236 [Alternaria alternata]|nr:hypothetical protein IG631_14236 [Alternaria alternata]